MKPHNLLICIILFSSCATLQVASDKNARNVSSLGIEWTYSGDLNEVLPPKLDSSLNVAMEKFNAGSHVFTVHKKLPKDKDFISIDFTKGKVPGKGQKAAGYIVTGVGLIAAPAVLIAVNSPYLITFYYWPFNMVYSDVALSPSLSYEKTRDKKLIATTGALFARTKPQVNKLAGKYSNGFYDVLVKIENQLKQH